MIKSFKMYEKFRSLNISRTLKWIDPKIKEEFINNLEAMSRQIDIPLSELSDDNFEFLTRWESIEKSKPGDHNFWFQEGGDTILYTKTVFATTRIYSIENDEEFFMVSDEKLRGIGRNLTDSVLNGLIDYISLTKVSGILVKSDTELSLRGLTPVEGGDGEFLYELDDYLYTLFNYNNIREEYMNYSTSVEKCDFCIKYRVNDGDNVINKLSDKLRQRGERKSIYTKPLIHRLVDNLTMKSYERMVKTVLMNRGDILNNNIGEICMIIDSIYLLSQSQKDSYKALNYKTIRRKIDWINSLGSGGETVESKKIEKWINSLDFNNIETLELISEQFKIMRTNYYNSRNILVGTVLN